MKLALATVALCVVFPVAGATLHESFASDPRAHGWRVVGDTNLWRWNATNEHLEVTWDSSRSNSFLAMPLGTVLSKSDDFAIAFDLLLHDIAFGTSSNKPYTFQIALGLVNSMTATNANAYRGAGQSATYGVRNTVEFAYFPDSGFGATFAPTVISTNNRVAYSHTYPLTLTTGDLFRVTMNYTASNQVLKTAVTRNGAPYGLSPGNTIRDVNLSAHPDFRVDTLAIINWSDAIQAGSPQFWGSVLARGWVDNLSVTHPGPPVSGWGGARTNGAFRASFWGRTNWQYALERTSDFANWLVVSATNSGTAGTNVLMDPNAPGGRAFYRVRAMKP
jgi:hypothetical protein